MKSEDQISKLRLYPKPRALAGEEEVYQDLLLPPQAHPLLPYVLVNMVSSVDGRSSSGGKASGIGSRADRGAMRALRSSVDAVMVGAGTLRAERLNLGLDEPGARQPLAVIVGGSRDLPLRERLADAGQDVILALPEGALATVESSPDDRLTVIECPGTGHGRVDLGWLLKRLKFDHAVDRLLVEGGPTLNRALIDRDLADEIFLTLAPKLLSGNEAAIVRGDDAVETQQTQGRSRALELLSIHTAGGEIFLRYRLQKSTR